MKIKPSGPCTDAEFLRRVYLDLTGLPPTAEDVRAFLADPTEARVKRDELVDRLIGSKEYVEYWTNKWADLLQVNRKFLGVEGAVAFRKWIRDQVASNAPYDQFVRAILTRAGRTASTPRRRTSRSSATRGDDGEHDAALPGRPVQLQQVPRPPVREAGPRTSITRRPPSSPGSASSPTPPPPAGPSAAAPSRPRSRSSRRSGRCPGEMIHDRTKKVAPPVLPYATPHRRPRTPPGGRSWRAWITSKDNPYFARSYVNRLWGYLFGVGIIEPLDDLRAGNPATNPELLDYLTEEFLKSGFDPRHVIRLICKSRTYQLSVSSNEWNEDDKINYSHATARRGSRPRCCTTPSTGRRAPSRSSPASRPAPGRPSCPTPRSSCPAAS